MRYACELCGHSQERHYMHKVHNLIVCKPCTLLADRLDVTCFPSATTISLPGLLHLVAITQDGDDYACTVYPNKIDYANHKDRGVKTFHETYYDALRYGILGLLADYYTLREPQT